MTRASKEKENLPSSSDPFVLRNKQSDHAYFQQRSNMLKNSRDTVHMLPTPDPTPTKATKSVAISVIEMTNGVPAETTTEGIEKTEFDFMLRDNVPVTHTVNNETNQSNFCQGQRTSKDIRDPIHTLPTPEATPGKANLSVLPAINGQTHHLNFDQRLSISKDTRDPIHTLPTPDATPIKASDLVTPAINSSAIQSHLKQRATISENVRDSIPRREASESVTPAINGSLGEATGSITPAINDSTIQSHLNQEATTSKNVGDPIQIVQAPDTTRSEVIKSLPTSITQTANRIFLTFGKEKTDFAFDFDVKLPRKDTPMVQLSLPDIPATRTTNLPRSQDAIPVFHFGNTTATDTFSTEARTFVFSAASKLPARPEIDSRETIPTTPELKVIGESSRTLLGEMASMSDTEQTTTMSTTDNIKDEMTNGSAMTSTNFEEESMGLGKTVICSPVEVAEELESSKQAVLASSTEEDTLSLPNADIEADGDDKENMPPHQVQQLSSLPKPITQHDSDASSSTHIPGGFPTTPFPMDANVDVGVNATFTKDEALQVDDSPEHSEPTTCIEEGQDQDRTEPPKQGDKSVQVSSTMTPGNPIVSPDLSAPSSMPPKRESSLSRIYNSETHDHGYGYAVITPPRRYSAYLTSFNQSGVDSPPPPTITPKGPNQAHLHTSTRVPTSAPEMMAHIHPSLSDVNPPSHEASTEYYSYEGSEDLETRRCALCRNLAPGATANAGTQTDVEVEPWPLYEELTPKTRRLSGLALRRLRESITKRFRKN